MPATSGTIRVNFASVASAADSIEAAKKQIDAQLAELRSYCDQATSKWQGSTRDAYKVLQTQWDQTANELNTNLQQIANGVRTGHANFVQAATKSTQVWQG